LTFYEAVKIKLLKKVAPNNNLVICADLLSFRRGVAKGVAKGKIDNAMVCIGEFIFISPHAVPLPRK